MLCSFDVIYWFLCLSSPSVFGWRWRSLGIARSALLFVSFFAVLPGLSFPLCPLALPFVFPPLSSCASFRAGSCNFAEAFLVARSFRVPFRAHGGSWRLCYHLWVAWVLCVRCSPAFVSIHQQGSFVRAVLAAGGCQVGGSCRDWASRHSGW